MSDLSPPQPNRLPLEGMAERHHGLTPEVAACYHQAARVCLDRHHTAPVCFELRDKRGAVDVAVDWERTTDRERDAHANRDDATEAGAYIFALASVELRDGLYAMRRVQVGGRADYFVAPAGTSREDLEASQRLEVSGVDSGDRHAVARRLTAKVAQVSSKGDFPALAGVVGFSAATIMLRHIRDAV